MNQQVPETFAFNDLHEECQLLLKQSAGGEINMISAIRQRSTHVVYRIGTRSCSFILKHFLENTRPKELQVYRLLQELAVPTLPCHAIGRQSIVLIDRRSSTRKHLPINTAHLQNENPMTVTAAAEFQQK